MSKNTYEQRLDRLQQNTNMEKKDLVKPFSVRIEERDQERKDKEAEDAKPKLDPWTVKNREKKAIKKEAQKQTNIENRRQNKDSADEANKATLFCRNIGWDTTEE